jgi:hypothetical protein
MPEGIIRDPRQNPVEKEYGIVYIPELDINIKYFKTKGSPSRGLIAGVLVNLSEPTIRYYPEPQEINGILVRGYTPQQLIYDKTRNQDDAPAVHKFMEVLGDDDGVRNKIDYLVNQGKIDSEVPEDE